MNEYTDKENRLADLAKAISHPARIKILHFLTAMKSCFCGEIVEELPLSQSTVSQHLKELKRVGFITGNVDGPKCCYCVNPKVIKEARELFETHFKTISSCC